TDDDALEDLDPLPVALDHADVDLQGVAGREIGDVVAQVRAIDEIGAVHEGAPGRDATEDASRPDPCPGTRPATPRHPRRVRRRGRGAGPAYAGAPRRAASARCVRGRPNAAPQAPPSRGNRRASCTGGTRATIR